VEGKTGKMADSASEFESDTSSVDGGPTTKMVSPGHMEQLNKRIESLQQENRVLRMELDTYKLRCKTLQEDNRELRQASVTIVSCSGQYYTPVVCPAVEQIVIAVTCHFVLSSVCHPTL